MLIKASVSKESGYQSGISRSNAATSSSSPLKANAVPSDHNKLNENIARLELANEYLTPIIDEIITHATTYSQRDFRRILETKSPICTISYCQFSKAYRASEIIIEVNDNLQISNEFTKNSIALYTAVAVQNPYDELIQTINEVGDRIYIDRDLMKQLVDLHELIADTIKKLRAALVAEGAALEDDEVEKTGQDSVRSVPSTYEVASKPVEVKQIDPETSDNEPEKPLKRKSVLKTDIKDYNKSSVISDDSLYRKSVVFEPDVRSSCTVAPYPMENNEKPKENISEQESEISSRSKYVQTESTTYTVSVENNALHTKHIVNSVHEIEECGPIILDDENNVDDLDTFKPTTSTSLKNWYDPVEFEKNFVIVDKVPEKKNPACRCCASICNKTPTTTVQQMTQTNEFKIVNPSAFAATNEGGNFMTKQLVENFSQTLPIIFCKQYSDFSNIYTKQTSSQTDDYFHLPVKHKQTYASKLSVDKSTSFTQHFYKDLFKVSNLFPILDNQTPYNNNNNVQLPTCVSTGTNYENEICLRKTKIFTVDTKAKKNILEEELTKCTEELTNLRKMYKDLSAAVEYLKNKYKSENQITLTNDTNDTNAEGFNYYEKTHEEVLAFLKELDGFKDLLSELDDANVTLDEDSNRKNKCCAFKDTPHIHAMLNDIPIIIRLHQSTIDILLSEKVEDTTPDETEEIKEIPKRICKCENKGGLNLTVDETLGDSCPVMQNLLQGAKLHTTKKSMKMKGHKCTSRMSVKIKCLKNSNSRINKKVVKPSKSKTFLKLCGKMGSDVFRQISKCRIHHGQKAEEPSLIHFEIPMIFKSSPSGSNSSYYTIKSNRSEKFVQTAMVETKNLPYKDHSLEFTDPSECQSSTGCLPYLVHKNSLPNSNICPAMKISIDRLRAIMRSDSIAHPKDQIKRHLCAFGVDNIIEASKPAVCCREAVINGAEKDEEPFHASLNSLPLTNSDIQLITEVAGVDKNYMSTYLTQVYKTKFEYYTNFQENLTSNIDYFLPKTPVYEVRFFEIFWKDDKNSNKDRNGRNNMDKDKVSFNLMKKVTEDEEQKNKALAKERRQYHQQHKHNHSEHRRHCQRERAKSYNKMCQTEEVTSEAFYFQASSNSLPRNNIPASVSRSSKPVKNSSDNFRNSAGAKLNKPKVDPLGDDSSLSPKNYAETLSAIYELDDAGKLRPKGKIKNNQSNEFKANSSKLSAISSNGNRVKRNRSNQSGSSGLSYVGNHVKEFKANPSNQSALSGFSFNSNLGTIFEGDEKHKDRSASTSVKSKSIDDFLEFLQNPEISESVQKFISSEAAMRAFERSNIDFNKFWSIYFEEKHKSVGCETVSAKSNSRSSSDTSPPKLKAKKKMARQPTRRFELSDSSSDNAITNRTQRPDKNSQLKDTPLKRRTSNLRVLEETTAKEESLNSLRSLQLLASRNGPGYISVLHPVCGCPEVSIFIPCYCDDCKSAACKSELTAKNINRLVSTRNGRHIILPKTCRIQKSSEIGNCPHKSNEINRCKIHKGNEIGNYCKKSSEIRNNSSEMNYWKIQESNEITDFRVQHSNEIKIPTKVRTNSDRIRMGESFYS